MATRTISNTGGNYNAVGTWVEGVVPTSADDVVATATSGQLTVNVASAASTFNFTNYANTLTMNNTWTVSGTGTQSFVAGMTISGFSNISLTGAGATIVTNGKLIPNLSINGNKTLSDTVNVLNMTFAGNSALTNNSINCSGTFSSGINSLTGTSTVIISGTGSLTAGLIANPLTINTTGTVTGTNIGIGLGTNGTMSYISGTLSSVKVKAVGANVTINQTATGSFETIDILTVTNTQVFNIYGTVKANFLNINLQGAGTLQTQISGSGALSVGDAFITPYAINSVGIIQYKPNNLQLHSGATHSFTTISSFAYENITSNTTSSGTASTISSASGTVNIIVADAENSLLSNVNFTNVNASGGQTLYVRGNGALSGTTNIIKTTNVPAASTAGGSYTFVN